MNKKELRKFHLIASAIEGKCTVKQVAMALDLTERRVKQLKKEMKANGAGAVIHGNRGKRPAHAVSDELSEKIISLRKTYEYELSNFTHFQELLEEHENIKLSYSALHNVLSKAKIKSPKKHKKTKLHPRRKRKESAGMMLQADGTPHAWFGGNQKYSLHGFIDDATGMITGLYMAKYECLLGYLEVTRQTLCNFGVPLCLYPDKYSVFFPAKSAEENLTIEEQLSGETKSVTQFGMIMKELGINMFAASSSQAKGRIEKLWDTLQSRLVTEFRIHKITTIEQANAFFPNFIKKYNNKFAVLPEKEKSSFIPLHKKINLDELLCVKITRVIDNSGTFSLHNCKFQVETKDIPPRTKITIIFSEKIGMKVLYNDIKYSVKSLDFLAPKTKKLPINSSNNTQMSDVLKQLISEYYLKDAKAC
jgi:transposase